MKKSSLTILIVILVIIVGGYIILKDSKPAEAPPVTSQEMPVPGEGNTPEIIVESEKVIIYSNSGYSPASLKIRAGETVVFKNKSSQNMWPASAKHPTHDGYPTTGGCLGSTFDACKAVPPGEAWSFKFDVKGDWKFHDHLTPKYFGSIVVE